MPPHTTIDTVQGIPASHSPHRAGRGREKAGWMGQAAAVALLGLGAAACQNAPPRGMTGGRIDIYRSTEADVRAPEASGPELWVYSDQVAEALARDLADIDPIRTAPNQLVLELGDLRNRTRTPTGDFELIQHRIRAKLMQSRIIRDHFKIVEQRQRMDEQQRHVAGQSDQPTARYLPEQTYLLMGDFFESRRGPTRRYFFTFKLTHLASRQIVFSSDYDLAQSG